MSICFGKLFVYNSFVKLALNVYNYFSIIKRGDKMKIYNKLVRDNIPQIIEQSGKTCKTRVLTDAEYAEKLNAKLNEEFAEYMQSGEVEELADIVEVALAIARAKGVSTEKFDEIRLEKSRKNGAFGQKLLLEWVNDD